MQMNKFIIKIFVLSHSVGSEEYWFTENGGTLESGQV